MHGAWSRSLFAVVAWDGAVHAAISVLHSLNGGGGRHSLPMVCCMPYFSCCCFCCGNAEGRSLVPIYVADSVIPLPRRCHRIPSYREIFPRLCGQSKPSSADAAGTTTAASTSGCSCIVRAAAGSADSPAADSAAAGVRRGGRRKTKGNSRPVFPRRTEGCRSPLGVHAGGGVVRSIDPGCGVGAGAR